MDAVSVTELITSSATIITQVAKGVLRGLAFQDELEHIGNTLDIVKNVLTHMNEEQLEQDEVMQTWIRLLKDAVYDAENLLGTLATGLRQNQNQVSRFLFKARVQPSIRRHNRRFDHLRNNALWFQQLAVARNHEISGGRISPYNNLRFPTATSQVDASTIVGRQDDTQKIVNMLLESDCKKESGIRVIRIVGMAGMGKTTLAQLVYRDPNVERYFEEQNRIWVSVTMNFDLSRILKEIMMKCNPEKNHTNLPKDQLCEAFKKFISGRRFFLVLDDAWTEDDKEWIDLLRLLEKGAKGSRVVATSQKSGFPYDPIFIHELNLLSDIECWSLFQRTAFGQGNSCPPELEEYGKKIVSKCQNLPLAVQAMAAFLKSDPVPPDETKWRNISEVEYLLEAEKSVHF